MGVQTQGLPTLLSLRYPNQQDCKLSLGRCPAVYNSDWGHQAVPALVEAFPVVYCVFDVLK